ncbi:MAG TPA: hypothetical protein VN426_02455 [Syntrophomonadaceae bacterium]|nr:hypothetical protein [Syntrophomonadaceae bacterium]
MAEPIIVEIYGGTCASSCATCGGSCSTGSAGSEVEKEVKLISQEVEKLYGQQVTVNYVDTDVLGLSKFPLISRAIQGGYSFPIIAMNGRPRLAGGIDLATIKEILDQEIDDRARNN